jgi:hypothetical protein
MGKKQWDGIVFWLFFAGFEEKWAARISVHRLGGVDM